MHRFYSADIDPAMNRIELDESETRHLRDVLRIREGETVKVFDGTGYEVLARVEAIEKRSCMLSIDGEVAPTAPESPLDLTLAVAITKGEKFELVVQKSVELGVHRIIPIVTHRCDMKASGLNKRAERWRKIALEASKQCGRARLISIAEPCDVSNLMAAEFEGYKLLFSERNGTSLGVTDVPERVLAVIGPEGGWEDSELDSARKAGFRIVTLGGRVMRAETAAISIAAVLQHRFGDLN